MMVTSTKFLNSNPVAAGLASGLQGSRAKDVVWRVPCAGSASGAPGALGAEKWKMPFDPLSAAAIHEL